MLVGYPQDTEQAVVDIQQGMVFQLAVAQHRINVATCYRMLCKTLNSGLEMGVEVGGHHVFRSRYLFSEAMYGGLRRNNHS